MLFWRDKWIHGFSAADIAPLFVATVLKRTINSRTVQGEIALQQSVLQLREIPHSVVHLEELGAAQMQALCLASIATHALDLGSTGETWASRSAIGVFRVRLQAEDNIEHILVGCTYALEVWHKVFNSARA